MVKQIKTDIKIDNYYVLNVETRTDIDNDWHKQYLYTGMLKHRDNKKSKWINYKKLKLIANNLVDLREEVESWISEMHA